MEIHFYYDAVPTDKFVYTSYNSTKHAIDVGLHNILTTSIANLNFDLLDKGYKIFLHENGKTLEAKPKMEGTKREIRKAHNILKMWIAGTFNEYFNRK